MSDVPEMVERVARAMCVADNRRDPDDTSGGLHPLGQILDEGEPWWHGFVEVARAGIEAMAAAEPPFVIVMNGKELFAPRGVRRIEILTDVGGGWSGGGGEGS